MYVVVRLVVAIVKPDLFKSALFSIDSYSPWSETKEIDSYLAQQIDQDG